MDSVSLRVRKVGRHTRTASPRTPAYAQGPAGRADEFEAVTGSGHQAHTHRFPRARRYRVNG